MTGLDVVLTEDPRYFAARTSRFLSARAERNVAATVLASVLAGRAVTRPLFAYGQDATGEVRFAVLRTPPWPLLVSDLDPALAPTLLEHWLEVDPQPPGVSGLPAAARAVSSGWRDRTGGHSRCRMRQALHALEEVLDPPRPAPGGLRAPRAEERALLVAWHDAVAHEAGLGVSDESEALVDERLSHGGWFIWDDGGPVSLVGMTRPVAGAVRLGPVYTPPESRNRGYASSAVAAASRRALAEGVRRCLLFTDLANPTSNKIYAEVGYRRVADWEEHAFQPASPVSVGVQPGEGDLLQDELDGRRDRDGDEGSEDPQQRPAHDHGDHGHET